MKFIYFLLEEESAKELLNVLLPRIFSQLHPNENFKCIAFEGKQDLEKNISIKLKEIKTPNTYFVILRDQDSSDCIQVKEMLQTICQSAFRPETMIRVACKELESWYFGDLEAVEKALNINKLADYSRKQKYRNPDSIVNPKEELRKITKNKYNQVTSSRIIGKYLKYESNTSHSFKVFIDGLKKVIEQ